jgi:L-Ala-D/L-Glu epimerase
MQFSVEQLDLVSRFPFFTSRGGSGQFANVVLKMEAGGLVGWGEGHPIRYYGETRDITLAALDHLARELPDHDLGALSPERIREILTEADLILAGNPAAKAALDCALWDLLGKQRGLSPAGIMGLDITRTMATSFTIGLADPPLMLTRATEAVAAGFEILKIKCCTEAEILIVEKIAEQTGARLLVDINGAWTAREALPRIERLAMAGVELVEQPLATGDLAGYREIAGRAPVPVVLDESIGSTLDLEIFGEYCDGVNIKITKQGGLTRSLDLARQVAVADLDLMVGCTVESSLGISQGLQLMPLCRWIDLDGALLLEHDPFRGVPRRGAVMGVPEGPGLGIERREP